ncbi:MULTISPECIES: transcriptional regulator [Polyangium]|uniref:Transcriptional regulator n=1 Tax=Polyangium jinanense TaxID=2829994 RepID=A0A9X4AUV2_9BACT|nr:MULTISPECIES: transcriptional regulator [Polyangium]MDC3956578.1 transcriptional regulator [Polyangium jinanense]MDC3985639.1 transcriptional regulator [Polyangium jinanense]MDI3285746.1 transcriptional regulator [Polyangium sp. 15x6]
MPLPKSFQNFAEFEREIIRAGTRVNLSLEDIVEDTSFEEEMELDQDDDPFASMRDF